MHLLGEWVDVSLNIGWRKIVYFVSRLFWPDGGCSENTNCHREQLEGLRNHLVMALE